MDFSKKKVIIKAVTEQVINMYENNVLHDNGAEGFLGWIADGEVFGGDFTDEELESVLKFCGEIAPLVDELTFKYLNTDDCLHN